MWQRRRQHLHVFSDSRTNHVSKNNSNLRSQTGLKSSLLKVEPPPSTNMYERSIKELRLSDVSLEVKCAICEQLLSSKNLWPPPGPPVLDHALFVLTTTPAKRVSSLLERYWGFVRQIVPKVDLNPSHYSLLCDAALKNISEGPPHLVNEVFRCLRTVCELSQYWPVSVESSARLLGSALERVSEDSALQSLNDSSDACNRLAISHALIQSRHKDPSTVCTTFLDHLLNPFAHSAYELQSQGGKLLMGPIFSSSAESLNIVVNVFTSKCDIVSKNMLFVVEAFTDAINSKMQTYEVNSMEEEHRSIVNEVCISEARQFFLVLLKIIQHCLDKLNQGKKLYDEPVFKSLSLLFSHLHTPGFSVIQSTLNASRNGFTLSEGGKITQRLIVLLCTFLRSARKDVSLALKALTTIMREVNTFGMIRGVVFSLITDKNVCSLAKPQDLEALLCAFIRTSYQESLIPELFRSLASAAIVTGGEQVRSLFFSRRVLGDLAEVIRLLPRTHSAQCVKALRGFTNGTYSVALVLATVVVESAVLTELSDVVDASLRLLDEIQQSPRADRSLTSYEIYLVGSVLIANNRVTSQDDSRMATMIIRSFDRNELYLSGQDSLIALVNILQSRTTMTDGFELYCVLRILGVFTMILLTQRDSESIVKDFATAASNLYRALLKPNVNHRVIPFLGRSSREEATNHINVLRDVLQRHERFAAIDFGSVKNRKFGVCDQNMLEADPVRIEDPVITIDDAAFGPLAFISKVSSILRKVSVSSFGGLGLNNGRADVLTDALNSSLRNVASSIADESALVIDSEICSRVTRLLLLVICARRAFRNITNIQGDRSVRETSRWILDHLQHLLAPLLRCMEESSEIKSRSHGLSGMAFLCTQVTEDRFAGEDALSILFQNITRLVAAKDEVLLHAGLNLLHIIARRSSDGLKLISDVLTIPQAPAFLRSQSISVLSKNVQNRWTHRPLASLQDVQNIRRMSDHVRLVRYEGIVTDKLRVASTQLAPDATFFQHVPHTTSLCVLCGSNVQAVYAVAHHTRSVHTHVNGQAVAEAEQYLCKRCQVQHVKSWKHLRALRQVRNMSSPHSKIREEAELVGENIPRELLKGMVADTVIEGKDRVVDFSLTSSEAAEILDELAISHDVSQARILAAFQQKRRLYVGK